MDLGLSGKRALVVGATRGLGNAIAHALHAEGALVTLAGRDPERLLAATEPLPGASTLVLDMADRASLARALQELGASGETTVDILVNNGGGPPPGSVLAVSPDAWRQHFETMVNAVFELTAHLVPAMRARGFGRVVNVVSSGVVQPIPNLGMSNALRASIVGYAKTLAAEVAADGVTVNSVLPGRISTDRLAQLDAAAAQRTGTEIEDVRKRSRGEIPAGRYGEPREFADVVAFLASTRASYVTGSAIRVDGGMIRAI